MLLLTGCSPSKWDVLNPKGSTAETQLSLIQLSMLLMSIVLVTVITLFTVFLVKYREQPGQTNRNPSQEAGNKKLEIIWTIIPILILTLLAIPTVQDTYKLADEPKEAEGTITVKVIAHQYWWEFEYPDFGITTAEILHVPVDKNVVIELTSADTIHSFWVPQLAGKQDAIRDRTNKLSFIPRETGMYRGSCAELCGAAHAYMRFHVKVESEADFDSWVEGMKNPDRSNLTSSEKRGKALFKDNCLSCHATNTMDSEINRAVAPHLGDFASRERIANVLPNTPEHLKKWLDNPEAIKPDVAMPSFKDKLNNEEKEDLINFLMSLEVEGDEK